MNFTQQYRKNRQRCQQNTMLYGNYCYIFIENFPQRFSVQTYSRKFQNVLESFKMFLNILECSKTRYRMLKNVFQNVLECSGNGRCYVLEIPLTLNSTWAKPGYAVYFSNTSWRENFVYVFQSTKFCTKFRALDYHICHYAVIILVNKSWSRLLSIEVIIITGSWHHLQTLNSWWQNKFDSIKTVVLKW